MKRIFYVVLAVFMLNATASFAQFAKLKQMVGVGKKDDTADTTTKTKKGLGGLLNKAVGSLAKMAATAGGSLTGMVSTTADLSTVEPQGYYMTNLHSKDVNVMQQTFFNGWEPGGNAVMLMFTAKNGVQFNKIDGEVQIDGAPANYVATGVYSAFLKDNASPKIVAVKTSSGQTAAFTLNPPKHRIKLLSVNGQANNGLVDLNKDVTLEVETGSDGNNTPVLVMLTGQVIGLRTFYEVGWFAPKSKIVIPAAMFRNMNGVTNNINFTNAYIQVSRSSIDNASNVTGAFKNVKYANLVTDGKFIQVSGKPQFNKGIEIKTDIKSTAGNKIQIEATKKQAIFSPPLSHIKHIGTVSFLMQGTTSFYDIKDNKWLETRTTKEVEFPVFPEQVYQNIMDNLYPQLMDVLKQETGAEVVPLEQITTSKAYQEARPFMGLAEKTRPDYTFTYKKTKAMVGLKPIAEMAGYNSPEHKIMAETGTNALVRVTINLDINFDGPTAVMVPKLIYEIPGETIGENYTAAYISGTVTGSPYKIKNKGNINPQALENEVLKATDLVEGFRKSIQLMKEKENANPDYKAEWDAMFN